MASVPNGSGDEMKAAAAMIVIAALEAWPLALIAKSQNGLSKLERLFAVDSLKTHPLAWTLALAVAAGYILASVISLPRIGRHLFSITALKLLAIPFSFVTGVFEELFFRKWLMDLAQGGGNALLAQMLLSAVLFGAVHGIWGLFGRSLRTAASAMLFTGALGLALAFVYVLSGRQVAPCVWSHTLINLAIEPWLLLSVMELNRPSAA